MAGGGVLQMLHISDLHVKKEKNFDLSVVLDPLIDRVGEDRNSGLVPELILVTGDVAHGGLKKEYDRVAEFFEALLKTLELPRDRLFIVPGNHDADLTRYNPSEEIPRYKTMPLLDQELETKKYRTDRLKGMSPFFKFVNTFCPHQKSLYGNLVPFVYRYESAAKKQIGLVGLNSAWMCRNKLPDREKIAIGEYQVKNAFAELAKKDPVDLTISLFHHPVEWLWPEDGKRLGDYLKNAMVLNGHFHIPGGGFCDGVNGGSRYSFISGALYMGSESKLPARFHYITCNWDTDEIRLDFRKLDDGRPKWVIDTGTGKEGVKVFENAGLSPGSRKPASKKRATPAKTLPEIPAAYKRWVIDRCKSMNIDRMREGSKVVSVGLPEVYIPLMAMPPHREPLSKKSGDGETIARMKEEKAREIAAIAGENDYLLIRGEAGSGKTTLLKQMAYTLISGENAWGLGDRLPVLLFLKEFKSSGASFKKETPNTSSAEILLDCYVKKVAQNGLDLETIRSYAAAGRILFLVDGLDEIDSGFRDFVALSLGEFRTCHHGCKLVLTGRPHGISGAVADRFSDRMAVVLDLTDDQIETFIRKWFLSVNGRESVSGQKTAEMMISELKIHQDIDILKRNPLMLTAICILYNDEKALPEQRAELYKKFITHLLVKRFGDDHVRVHKYMKELAHVMFMADKKGVDGLTAKEILRKYYPEETKESLNQRFETIENDSGLMRLESGSHRFSHLTFQEFLTATHMIDKEERDFANPIKHHWTNARFKEVIELYIGFLSMDNSGMAHRIVKEALEESDSGSFSRWRIAGRALLDIHPKSRQADTVTLAAKKMIEIIEKPGRPETLADAGESLGWLGDTRDLKTFVPIKGGRYTVKERGEVDILPFAISKYPVTSGWFGAFVKEKGYEKREFWSQEGVKWLDQTGAREPRFWNDRKWICPNAPVAGVSWYEADAFCKWLNKIKHEGYHTYRLPTESEWQAAAAGTAGRDYPWGKKWDETRCNNGMTGIGKTSPVGIFMEGKTPEGVYDMSGNVLEWTSSFDDDVKDTFVLRGGSWFSVNPDNLRCSLRYWYDPVVRGLDIGFRCART